MEAEGRKLTTRNALDNIRPNGGFRGFLYERTGLLPQEQDIGALRLVTEGKMTQEQLDMFLSSPDRLQVGNAGNAIMDRLAAMADDGALSRDPKWTPPTLGGEGTGAIRNPLAYAATARGNQERVSQALASVREKAGLPDDAREALSSAVARLGSTSDRVVAETIARSTLAKLPKDAKSFARPILAALVEHIKH